jgi:hypothetical protein
MQYLIQQRMQSKSWSKHIYYDIAWQIKTKTRNNTSSHRFFNTRSNIMSSGRMSWAEDRSTKLILNRKSKITLRISLSACIRAFHQTSLNRKSYDLRVPTTTLNFTINFYCKS